MAAIISITILLVHLNSLVENELLEDSETYYAGVLLMDKYFISREFFLVILLFYYMNLKILRVNFFKFIEYVFFI